MSEETRYLPPDTCLYLATYVREVKKQKGLSENKLQHYQSLIFAPSAFEAERKAKATTPNPGFSFYGVHYLCNNQDATRENGVIHRAIYYEE